MNRALLINCVAGICVAGGGAAWAGPVDFLTFDGNVADHSGNGNNGTSSGGFTYVNDVPTQLAGSNTQSGSFDGNSAVVAVPVGSTSSSLYLNNVETVTLWMKATASAQSGQYRRNFSNANGSGLEFQEDGNAQSMSLRIDTQGVGGGINQLTGIGTTYDGAWHFVAVVLNNGSVTTYLDGAQTNTNTYSVGNGFGSTNPVTVGNSDQEANDFYNGLLSNAAIYGDALTSNQVAALYAGTSPNAVPEPAALGLIAMGSLAALTRKRRAVGATI